MRSNFQHHGRTILFIAILVSLHCDPSKALCLTQRALDRICVSIRPNTGSSATTPRPRRRPYWQPYDNVVGVKKSLSMALNAFSASINDESISSPDESTSSSSQQRQHRPRPDWARNWMPTWLVTMRPALQLMVVMLLYLFHLVVLTQKSIAFPYQFIANDQGHFQSIGLDSLSGMLTLVGYMLLRRNVAGLPSLWSSPTRIDAPWRRLLAPKPKVASLSIWKKPGPKSTSIICFILLVQTYFMTGRFSIFWEDVLYGAAGMGFPMTIAMHRSLCVLLGHLTWVVLGGLLLRIIPRPQPFFRSKQGSDDDIHDEESPSPQMKDEKSNVNGNVVAAATSETRQQQTSRWFRSQWNDYWVWWVVGGYYVSAWLFNIADFINQSVLPPVIFEEASEGVVSQLINPEHNDLLASVVGFIAPCLSAPWWEEVLYRGFLLPALCLQMNFPWAVLASGIVFSAHHMSPTGSIPLAFLGWAWAWLYAKSGNLMVTVMVHALWNSRVFLGNWLGL